MKCMLSQIKLYLVVIQILLIKSPRKKSTLAASNIPPKVVTAQKPTAQKQAAMAKMWTPIAISTECIMHN